MKVSNAISPKILVLFLVWLFSNDKNFSQSNDKCDCCDKINVLIETITANSDQGNVDADIVYEDLMFFCNNPIDLNTATREILEKLQILNDFQITSFLEYRSKKGTLLSVYELQFVYGFSGELAETLSPFVTVKSNVAIQDSITSQSLVGDGSHELVLRGQSILENQAGYNEEEVSTDTTNYTYGYLGSSLKLYARYTFHYEDKLYLGFLGEKDAGEPFFDSYNQAGFDFYSAYLQINKLGPVKTICLGNFNASFGQGLTTWTSSSYNKSISIMNIRQTSQGFRRYTSSDENRYFRGIAITTKIIKNIDFSLFYSNKKIDAYRTNLPTNTGESEEVFTTIITSGLHTTEGQFMGKDAVKENALGGNLTWKTRNSKIGANFTLLNYDVPYDKQGDGFEHVNNIHSKQFGNYSIDYALGVKNLVFFGETAYGTTHGFATIDGVLIPVCPAIAISALYRYYSPTYLSIYADALSEASSPRNESGFFLGTEIVPFAKVKLSAYFDYFKFPWLKYNVNAPSTGNEMMTQLEFFPNDNFRCSFRFKYESKDQNVTNENSDATDIKYTDPICRQNYRISLVYKISEKISGKNRFEYQFIDIKDGESQRQEGWLFYQDFTIEPFRIPFALWLRYTIFDIDSYDARIYAYENSMQYNYSCPAFYDSGCKYSIMAKYQMGRHLIIWISYGSVCYPYKTDLGSGLSETDTNTRSEVKVQILVKL